jgi:hypothetical protein
MDRKGFEELLSTTLTVYEEAALNALWHGRARFSEGNQIETRTTKQPGSQFMNFIILYNIRNNCNLYTLRYLVLSTYTQRLSAAPTSTQE